MALVESLEAKVNILVESALPPVIEDLQIDSTNGDVKIIVKVTDT